MHAISEYVRGLALPADMLHELAGDYVLEQHRLYLQLPYWFQPLFAPIPADQLEVLSRSSYLYFRFLLAIDGLLDTPAAPEAAKRGAQRLLVYCDLFETSVRGLGHLFPKHDPFWAALDECKQQYAGANMREKRLSKVHGDFSRETFEELAADKSAVCNAIVYALRSLGGNEAPVAQLLHCLREVHVALQYVDDVQDFRTDWEQGQYTYAHALVEAYVQEHQHIDARTLDVERLHKYLYVSGTASEFMVRSQEHFGRAIAIAQELALTEMAQLLAFHSERCAFHHANYEQQLAQARERASAGHSVATLADVSRIRPFDATRWIIAAPDGRNLLVNAPAAELYHLLAKAEHETDALQQFNAHFGTSLTPDAFSELVNDRFGGYQLLRGEAVTSRPPLPQAYMHLQVEFLAPRIAGALAAPLRPLYSPAVFWGTSAGLAAGLVAAQVLSMPAAVPTGTGLWVALPLVYASMLVHEFGHIAATARAGLRHGGIGFGFYAYVFPVLYADITDIWLATKQQRIIANLGGIFSQMLFAAGIAGAYAVSGYEPLRFAAGAISLMAVWQLNPFVRHDGYWLLSDLTNTPNLLPRANEVVRHALSAPALRELVASRGRSLVDRRAALFAYGVANASLLLIFGIYTCMHNAHLVLTFPFVLATLLLKLLTGTLHSVDVTRAHFAVLAFYLVVGRFVIRQAGSRFKQRAPTTAA